MIERLLLFLVISASTLPALLAFECYTCNMEDSEAEECVDKIETCEPGIESCTMVTYTTKGRTHIRKFCTSIGTPIYQYLLFFPGSALCQNIDTSNDDKHFSNAQNDENDIGPPGELVGPPSVKPPAFEPSDAVHRAKRVRRQLTGPPAPPRAFSSSLLCVCSTPKCNAGEPQEVLDRLMLNQLPKFSNFPKKQTNEGLLRV